MTDLDTASTRISTAGFVADGVSGHALDDLLRSMPIRPAAQESAAVLVMADMTSDRLSPALLRPFRGYVEFRDGDRTLVSRIVSAENAGDFCLLLTTPTAFSAVDTARLVCDALTARGALPEDQRAGVELALHETVANAILHGNLGLDSALSADAELYDVFCDRLKSLLESPESRRRWILVAARWSPDHLELTVEDEGGGYEVPAVADPIDDTAPSGRGLAIVRALASAVEIGNQGRSTVIRFDYER